MDFLINKKLKIFITLMETGSFSIATSVLYITRTPLSRVISGLERELKQRLFIRKNGTLIPTEFAQTIYRKVKSHYIFLHALEQEIGPTGKTKQLEIIFDEIYPESLKNLIISALTISGQKTNIMGRAVNSQIIEELCQTNNCIVISARNYLIIFIGNRLSAGHQWRVGSCYLFLKNSFSAANLISTGWPEHLYFFMRGLKILIWTPYTIFLNRH